MRNVITVLLSTLLLISCSTGHAKSSKSQVDSFLGLKNHVHDLNEPQATLIVMDDDDTLTMMRCSNEVDPEGCQYLGGPAWYEWQSGLVGSGSRYSVAKTNDELLDISTLLFAMNQMDYTEDDLAPILHKLSASGVRLLIETARGGSTLSATEMQLEKLKVPDSHYTDFLDMIKSNSLSMGTMNSASLPSPFTPCDLPGSREVTYRQGVMYVAGQNKGVMLECLLKYYERDNSGNPSLPIKNIVFIDDTQKNVDDVYNTFKDSTRYQVKALHYTAFDSHKEALTKEGKEGSMLRNKAKERWNAIRFTQSKQLLAPSTGK